MNRSVDIVAVTRDLMPQLVPLIDDYQRFYRCIPSSERNLKFFSDLIDKPEQGKQFAALNERGEPVGFVTLYFLPSSLSARTYCMLNDLYSLPETRGQGVGRRLIEHCREYCDVQGFDSLEWMTQKENERAQRLYDSLPAEKSEWLIYSLPSRGKDSS